MGAHKAIALPAVLSLWLSIFSDQSPLLTCILSYFLYPACWSLVSCCGPSFMLSSPTPLVEKCFHKLKPCHMYCNECDNGTLGILENRLVSHFLEGDGAATGEYLCDPDWGVMFLCSLDLLEVWAFVGFVWGQWCSGLCCLGAQGSLLVFREPRSSSRCYLPTDLAIQLLVMGHCPGPSGLGATRATPGRICKAMHP